VPPRKKKKKTPTTTGNVTVERIGGEGLAEKKEKRLHIAASRKEKSMH